MWTKGLFVLKTLFVRFQKYLDSYGRDLNCFCAVLTYADKERLRETWRLLLQCTVVCQLSSFQKVAVITV